MNIIKIFITLLLTAVLVGSVGLGLFYSIDTDGTAAVAASGSLTFTGNVSTGELVNLSSGVNTYTFEFNTTGSDTSVSNYINVNVSNGNNTSEISSGKLTTAINANASTAALVNAVNTTNLTTLTADTAGTGGNSIGTTETATNAQWASSTLLGGSNAIAGWDITTILLWGFIALVCIAVIIIAMLKDMGIKIG